MAGGILAGKGFQVREMPFQDRCDPSRNSLVALRKPPGDRRRLPVVLVPGCVGHECHCGSPYCDSAANDFWLASRILSKSPLSCERRYCSAAARATVVKRVISFAGAVSAPHA